MKTSFHTWMGRGWLGLALSWAALASGFDEGQPPQFLLQPEDLRFTPGATGTLYAEVEGGGPVVVRWWRDGQPWPLGWLPSPGNGLGQYLESLAVTEPGNYTAVFSNHWGYATSRVAVVSLILAPELRLQPQGTSLPLSPGNTWYLDAWAAGAGPLFARWLRDGLPFTGWTEPEPGFDPGEWVTSLLATQGGNYAVVFSNQWGRATSQVAVVEFALAPQFRAGPYGVELLTGPVPLAVNVAGAIPLNYHWRRDGQPVFDDVGSALRYSVFPATLPGEYSVIVSNQYGSITGLVATVSLPAPPQIVWSPPASTNITAQQPRFCLPLRAAGRGLTFQWHKNGQPAGAARYFADTASFDWCVENPTPLDTGLYFAVVTNYGGSVTSVVAQVNVLEAAAIAGFTTNVFAGEGEPASLAVQAVGPGTLRYQWLRLGQPISGATNATLTLASVGAGDYGGYYVRVSNDYGAVTAGPMELARLCLAGLAGQIEAGGVVELRCGGTVDFARPLVPRANVILYASIPGVVLSGGGAHRLFEIPAGVSVTLRGVTLADGYHTGAQASADGFGGGILNRGDLVLENCVISNCFARGADGAAGPGLPSTGGGGLGGAVYNEGTLRAADCAFLGCRAQGGNASDFLTFHDFNHALGGAVYSENYLPDAVITFGNCVFAGCSARTGFAPDCTRIAVNPCATPPQRSYGGALHVAGAGGLDTWRCRFLGNTASGGASAGGAVNAAVDYRAADCLFQGNSLAGRPASGGAVAATRKLTLTGCAFAGNFVTGNQSYSARGGAVFANGELCATNCTWADNRAIGDGITGGGALWCGGATGALAHVTFARNALSLTGLPPPPVPDFRGAALYTASPLTVVNSIFGGQNTNAIAGVLVDGGGNFCDDATAAFTAADSFNETDPRLGPLADYGGPTPTVALLEDSPAIDAANPDGCTVADQRSYLRSGPCDSGAFEFASQPLRLELVNANRLRAHGPPHSRHALEASENLNTWEIILIVTLGPDGGEDISLPNRGGRCFYRLATE